jgi:sporulation protein YlmC with PRC-barrel domain
VIRLSQLIGQRVVQPDGLGMVGSLQRLLLDPGRSTVIAAQLERPEGGDVIMDWAHVANVTNDSVVVHAGQVTRPADSEQEQRLIAGQLELLGKTVLTQEGDSLGELEDLELDEISGRLVRIHAADHAVPVDRLVALGPDALIIATTRPTSTTASSR